MASSAASAHRLKAMAAERAVTMHTTIQTSCIGCGQPRAASTVAVSAKGRAKTECSHLIISRVWPMERRSGIVQVYPGRLSGPRHSTPGRPAGRSGSSLPLVLTAPRAVSFHWGTPVAMSPLQARNPKTRTLEPRRRKPDTSLRSAPPTAIRRARSHAAPFPLQEHQVQGDAALLVNFLQAVR